MTAPVEQGTPRPPGGCRPGMRGCRRYCGHRAIVTEYRAARDAQQAQLELAALGYATETATFYQHHQKITFRWWLEQRARGAALEEAMAA